MKVLVACEYSGTVRDAFIARGHDAMSCDLLPTDVPGPHYQGDVFDVIGGGLGYDDCSSALHLSQRLGDALDNARITRPSVDRKRFGACSASSECFNRTNRIREPRKRDQHEDTQARSGRSSVDVRGGCQQEDLLVVERFAET